MNKKINLYIERNNIFPATAVLLLWMLTVLCEAGLVIAGTPDAYEPDNRPAEAQVIVGRPDVFDQQHSFHNFFDEDWMKFTGEQGVNYRMTASDPSSNTK
eukprot:CAMPEP_0201282272 /NCGR_PEP_ID=MMETSP1317-20130820/5211_1 /ASSEMBLY_ACC=CAM_ASM_000770 /TAXON_ID=187299 /ORGANISM="Undescribed Undescribed, Strain Undescribed" /LENGTH=99 /DNA_ID=CAMNT_0047594455 /DNA_START=306 /DNA_END=602 /DNA_ORIENTATION=-